jgi:hypothetical protein
VAACATGSIVLLVPQPEIAATVAASSAHATPHVPIRRALIDANLSAPLAGNPTAVADA